MIMSTDFPTPARPVSLAKPSAVLHYVATMNGGDHELIMRGTPVRITADMVEYKITSCVGATSGTDWTERFPFLVGASMIGARHDVILFG